MDNVKAQDPMNPKQPQVAGSIGAQPRTGRIAAPASPRDVAGNDREPPPGL